MSLPKIVCIGGGTGMPTILQGLKSLPIELTAIVTVTDDGGSSGLLRKELDIIAPGDIRSALTSLAPSESFLSQLCQYRFPQGATLNSHALGNLILAAAAEITGNFPEGINILSKLLSIKGTVLPASEESIILSAKMADGSTLLGECNIRDSDQTIRRLSIIPRDAQALTEVRDALLQADMIIIGPGSLYTSILPNLLIRDISNAIKKSSATKVFICNIMTESGETDNFSASQHLEVLFNHLGFHICEVALINTEVPPPNILKKYASRQQILVEANIEAVQNLGYQVISDKLVTYPSVLRHDAEKVNTHIWRLIQGNEAQQKCHSPQI